MKQLNQNAREKIEPNMRNKIEQLVIKQKKILRNTTALKPKFKAYLNNIPIPPLTTLFGRNTAN